MSDHPGSMVALRVLQRVVLPVDHDKAALPLYVETGPATAGENGQSYRSPAPDGSWSPAAEGTASSRRSCVVHAGRHVSFGTYFNAFPASYWRRWTTVEEVLLGIRIRGPATILVYRSTAKGHSWPEETVHVDAGEPQDVELTLSLAPFVDGGWYWFDILAGRQDATLESAEWSAITDRLQRGRLSIGITTYNRPDFCLDQMRTLGHADDVLELLDEVFIVDQGTKRVEDHPDYTEASKNIADRLSVITQGNLGGSGGFARVMDETVRAGCSDYALLLDDDVVSEPESILRAAAFADLAREPTIVGGHMFSLYVRSVLHVFGETIASYRWFWGAHPETESAHDFAQSGLRETPWLHYRIDVDYNAWWMCLIPVEVIRNIGLALPVFIKWDDAEYGVRAAAAGYPTVTMPGVAVWHMPFHEKDDTIDWQAYFHHRNRLVTALLHSPYERGGAVITESFQILVRHLLSMRYSPATMALQAIEDVLAGPDQLHPNMLDKLDQVRAARKTFTDAKTQHDVADFPPVRRRKPVRREKLPTSPKSKLDLMKRAALGASRQALPVRDLAHHHPQLLVPHRNAKWWLLSQLDSALVSSADGTGTAWYKRDPEQFRALMQRSLVLHARLLREWPQLRRRYRTAIADVTSPGRWRQTFEASKR